MNAGRTRRDGSSSSGSMVSTGGDREWLGRAVFGEQWLRLVRLAALMRAVDPENIAAEAFVRFLERAPDSINPESIPVYLARTMVNLIQDAARRQRVQSRAMALVGHRPAVIELGDDDADPRLANALRGLPPRQREVIVLRYWMDLTEQNTATAMGITVGAVKSHTARALASLREDLTGDNDE